MKVAAALFLVLYTLAARADFVTDYNFTLTNPFKSTVSSAKLTAPAEAVNTQIKLRLYDRKQFSARRDLQVHIYPTPHSAHLIFILAGLGGTGDTPLAEYFASDLQAQGATVAIIPNSMTEEFVLGASSTGLVGDVNRDANDTYTVMQAVIAQLKIEGQSFSEISLTGYSLGALLAARVAEIDTRENRVGIESTLLINPPVDLLKGMRLLDDYYARFKSMGFATLIKLVNKVKKFIALLVGANEDADAVALSERELQGAIGYSMRKPFPDMILATQELNDSGILSEGDERAHDAKHIGFEMYVEKVLIPALQKDGTNLSIEQINEQSNLTAQTAFLRSAPNVYILHNADDFLMSAEDIRYIEATFGHRARIYPYGGHMGNLDNADNLSAVHRWMSGDGVNGPLRQDP